MAETRQLFINLKTQDKLREWFSKRGSVENIVFNNMSLGDSDINYELSSQLNKIVSLPTPYQTPSIKHKLTFDGNFNGLSGKINAYIRKIDKDGNISSQYEAQNNFKEGIVIPTVNQKYDCVNINFTNVVEGIVIFFETIPDGYVDSNGKVVRVEEDYFFSFENLPESLAITINPLGGSPGNVCSFSNTLLKSNTVFDIGNIVAIQGDVEGSINGLYKILSVGNNNEFNIVDLYNRSIDLTNKTTANLYLYKVTIDDENGSLLIAKGEVKLKGKVDGKIKATGKLTGIEKTITFNY